MAAHDHGVIMSSVLSTLFKSSRALSISGPALGALASSGKLVPLKLSGTEGLNQLFEYQLILQTPDALSLSLDLESNYPFQCWIGKELTCQIELEGSGSFTSGALGMAGFPNIGAGVREISGLITEARFVGVEIPIRSCCLQRKAMLATLPAFIGRAKK